MLPFRDDSPRGPIPWVTLLLITALFAVFAAQLTADANTGRAMVERWALVPAELVAHPLTAAPSALTSMLLHAGWGHMFANVLFLWVFAPGLERAAGRLRFTGLWLLGAVMAALAHAVANPSSTAPLIGASGAISAVMGATAVVRPNAPIRAAVFAALLPVGVVRVPAAFMLGVWLLVQLAGGLAPVTPSTGAGVAWYAHLGGFAAGSLCAAAFGRSIRSGLSGRRSRRARPPRTSRTRVRA